MVNIMDKYIEIALAKQIYALVINHKASDNYLTYIQTKNGIKDDESINRIELIKKMMSLGVSPITVLDAGYEKRPLIWHVFSDTRNSEIIELFIDSLKKEHLDSLDQSTIKKMYNSISVDDYAGVSSKYLKKIFEIGFDFEQGTFGEAHQAESGNQEFFEICMIYKKNFRFDFKYQEYYLDEVVKEELDCLRLSDPEYKTKENLMIFLKKAREVYTLKNNLEEDLPANTGKSNKHKI
jgi:hypothetical protein